MVDLSLHKSREDSYLSHVIKGHQTDFGYWKVIFSALLLWFGLAQISSAVFPETKASYSAAAAYLNYAVRNGGIFLALCSIVPIFRLMKQSGDLSFMDYIKTQRDKIPPATLRIALSMGAGISSFAVFIMSFSTIKTRIPVLNPYSWDVSFAAWDRAIFMGRDPWTLFTWIYDHPAILRVMDVIYDVWAAILVGIWALCFISRKYSASVRYRFPIALMLTWFLGGTIMAILFSSAGPCYYAFMTAAENPYVLQMAQLADINSVKPLRAVDYQGILWTVYDSGSLGLGGISAMPSMHCATSALLILFAWNRPVMRLIALTFFAFIFVSSFMLAWHYAVDGIFAVPIALLCWWLAGKITHMRKTS